MNTLQGRYKAENRNGGYFIKILEDYGHHSTTVSKEDWRADIDTLTSALTELDPRVEVNTQVGKLVWRFSRRDRDSNTGASAYFQGRAQSLVTPTARR
ncbi:DUF2461 domain-containing protein [Deinococcus detaillensis]|uniref:DUF2461 domain-containing protein n=1 Tax=Deinococcus detaillensis TaxID=2592048 RepID=A0A553V0T7_9DEIO|nr:DUF2461 domain-containing protein [Deinococcus detaillensis]TSA86077.1 DUF2461 domain-containing protein [Deinococcus detaillensis]